MPSAFSWEWLAMWFNKAVGLFSVGLSSTTQFKDNEVNSKTLYCLSYELFGLLSQLFDISP